MSGFSLSAEQHAAATSPKDHLLIIPPGCGKSEVLAHRAAHQIDSLEKNQRVLALTFTKRARSNLEERLGSVLGHARSRRQTVVRNFHGFATQVVLAHGRTIGLDMESLELPKTSTLRRAMEAAGGNGTAMYDAEQMLSDVKRNPLSDDEVLEAVQQRGNGQTAELAERVESARQDANRLHYDDLLRHAQRLLHVPAVARRYQAHFGAVLVDEFQDPSTQQLDLAILSCSSGGPSPATPSRASTRGPEPRPPRSRQRSGEPAAGRSDCTSPTVPRRRCWKPSTRSASRSIRAPAWYPPSRNGGLAEVAPWPLCSRTAARRPRLWRAGRSDPRQNAGGIHWGHRQSRMAQRGHRRDTLDGDGIPLAQMGPRYRRPLDRRPHPVGGRNPAARGEHCRSGLAVLDTVDLADVDTRELIDDAFDTLDRSDAATAKAAVRSIRTSDPKQAIGPGVHLLNAYTGKGQQFDWGFVVGLEEGHLPGSRNSKGDALAEEQRVLLVMLSRARHGLVVTRTRTTEGRYGPYQAKQSRWWPSLRAQYSSAEAIEGHLA